jgi:hypothetical protein
MDAGRGKRAQEALVREQHLLQFDHARCVDTHGLASHQPATSVAGRIGILQFGNHGAGKHLHDRFTIRVHKDTELRAQIDNSSLGRVDDKARGRGRHSRDDSPRSQRAIAGIDKLYARRCFDQELDTIVQFDLGCSFAQLERTGGQTVARPRCGGPVPNAVGRTGQRGEKLRWFRLRRRNAEPNKNRRDTQHEHTASSKQQSLRSDDGFRPPRFLDCVG